MKTNEYTVIQGVGGTVDYINQLRIDEYLGNIQIQNINLQKAINELNMARDFIGSPEHILGSSFTKHGEIAEVFDVRFGNADSLIQGANPDYSFDGVGRTAPEDYLKNGLPVQSKFVQCNLSMDAVLKHLNDYPDFVQNGGTYCIPKDFYDQIESYLKLSPKELINLPASEGGRIAEKVVERIHQIEAKTGKPFSEIIEPSQLSYDQVQLNQANNTIDGKEQEILKVDTEKRSEYFEMSKPSVQEGLKTAGIAAVICAALSFSTSLISTMRGKNKRISELDGNDWKDILKETGIGAVKGGISGGAIYTLTNTTNLAVPFAAALVSAALGVSVQAIRLFKKEITFDDFMYNLLDVATESSISGIGAFAGQVLIPIPVVGAIVGSIVASTVLGITKKHIFGGSFYEKVKTAHQEKQFSDEYKSLINAFDCSVAKWEYINSEIMNEYIPFIKQSENLFAENKNDLHSYIEDISKGDMHMSTITSEQVAEKAEVFVNENGNKSDDEISMIIAGMTSIIEGNECSYEAMKNQKWFQRIWYELTGKNKATVKEMKERRDQLTKYIIKIIEVMINKIDYNCNYIYDLYRSFAVIRCDLSGIVDNINLLAHKLNEKIVSVDNYHFLINEIRNEKFSLSTPLISLIDIMSMVDYQTAQDRKKLIQIKETMEKVGFDFSREIDMNTFSEEILSIPENKVGRILLFCQSFSTQSRILNYTCILMEKYFFLWDTEKRITKQNGEAVDFALGIANLNANDSCVIIDMYSDLSRVMCEMPAPTDFTEACDESLTPANYYSTKTTEYLNVIVAGVTGSGKSTLINSIFGWNIAATGCGQSVTKKTDKYSNDVDKLIIYDTVGIQSDSLSTDKLIADIKSVVQKNQNNVIWYTINSRSNRYEDDIVLRLRELKIPMITVLTYSIDDDSLERDIIRSNKSKGINDIPIISVLAKDYVSRNSSIPAYGLKELIDKTIEIAI